MCFFETDRSTNSTSDTFLGVTRDKETGRIRAKTHEDLMDEHLRDIQRSMDEDRAKKIYNENGGDLKIMSALLSILRGDWNLGTPWYQSDAEHLVWVLTNLRLELQPGYHRNA